MGVLELYTVIYTLLYRKVLFFANCSVRHSGGESPVSNLFYSIQKKYNKNRYVLFWKPQYVKVWDRINNTTHIRLDFPK